MENNKNGKYNKYRVDNYQVTEIKEIKEINCAAIKYEHEKTKASILYLATDDDNCVFSIAFKTPPYDNTGVAHIVEHSVLCGSRKFPVKEPFVELMKGSMNTFLNALTYPDKTVYPVASRNKKDFYNLIDVYLDAVFYPRIYDDKNIFLQEGWHYHILDKKKPLQYNGIVYNEMKGAYSSYEAILQKGIFTSLYPDSIYRYESGGYPDDIPSLTYEDFLNFHRTFYHPSNAFIVIYGNESAETILTYIDERYLRDFSYSAVNTHIGKQSVFNENRKHTFYYPIAENEDIKGKAFLSKNYIIGNISDFELQLGFDILKYILCDTSASPLKKELLDSRIGKDIDSIYETSIFQPYFSVIAKFAEYSRTDEFCSIIDDVLKKLAKNGFDKKMVESAINAKEFHLREADFKSLPKGIVYALKSYENWIHGNNPLELLAFEKPLQSIKAKANNYFENLIQTYLMQTNHSSFVAVLPQKGLLSENEQNTFKKLEKIKKMMKAKQLDDLIKDNHSLKEKQMSPDTKENLESIPIIAKKDLDREIQKIPCDIIAAETGSILYHPLFTNNITHITMYFPLNHILLEKTPYVSLLSHILGEIDTQHFSYEQLSQEIDLYTGGIAIDMEMFTDNSSIFDFAPMLIIKCKSLDTKTNKLFELLREIMTRTVFNNIKRLKEILGELLSNLQSSIMERGDDVAIMRLASHLTMQGKYAEAAKGLSFYTFVKNIYDDFDRKKDNLVSELSHLLNSVVVQNKNTIISVTSESQKQNELINNIKDLLNKLPKSTADKKSDRFLSHDASLKFSGKAIKEGILTASTVQYVVKGFNFYLLDYHYNGVMKLLGSILATTYLWNTIRVQGGAYGAFPLINRNGLIAFASYRDPNISRTLDVYNKIPEFLLNFKVSEREMIKFIIGTISKLDRPLTPSMKGDKSASMFISKIDYGTLQKEREEILDADVSNILQMADIMEAALKKDCYCVLGNENEIKKHKDLFTTITDVFK